MNITELSKFAADRADDIAEHLFPNGKKSSGEWCVGSISGEDGKSLKIRLTGAKRGTWKDFNEGSGGDLIDLWAARRCLSVAEAMAEIKSYLNVRDSYPNKPEPKNYKRPEKPKGRAASDGAISWLASRGISEKTIRDFKIVEQTRDGKTYAVFPYLREDGYINGKYRNIDDKKDMRQESGAEPCLFGWHLINPRCRTIFITEGEIDAMTLHQLGYAAVSVNAGAGNHQWVDSDFERLNRFSEIYLCYDNDDAGNKGVKEVANRLGIERCKVVHFGKYKDANEAFMDDMEPSGFAHYIASAKTLDPEELRQLSDFWGEVKSLFWPAEGKETFYPVLTFNGVDQPWFEFRPGEVSVWTGFNGHGKSLLLSQVQIGLMKQGEKFCVFSGEIMPRYQGKRMAKQITGVDRPTIEYLDAAGQWIADRAWIFNLSESASFDRLLEVFLYARKRYDIRHFVIDSLMMTDIPEDGTGALNAQKEAMRKIATFARREDVHVHLVAHPRKAQNEKQGPGKMDVAGSSKLTDAADNVFSVWADLKEEGEREDTPDAKLEIHKQRNGMIQYKKLWLFFNKQCQQYTTHHSRKPYHYVKFSTQAEYA